MGLQCFLFLLLAFLNIFSVSRFTSSDESTPMPTMENEHREAVSIMVTYLKSSKDITLSIGKKEKNTFSNQGKPGRSNY